MTILYEPTSLEMLGPFNKWCPPISIFLAFLPPFFFSLFYSLNHSLHTSSFSSTFFVPFFLLFYYLSVFYLSHFPLMANHEIYHFPTDFNGFSLFASLPFLSIFFFYFFLYKNNTNIQNMMHSIPISLIHTQQLYRLGGACFAYLYFTQPNYNSYFNLQTGFLDIFMGITAIPMGIYTRTHRGNLYPLKNVLWWWHFVGLYDLLTAFAMAGGNYLGVFSFGHSLGYLCFPPVTLICYFQVAWAMGIHLMYLTKFDFIVEAQKKSEKQKKKQ